MSETEQKIIEFTPEDIAWNILMDNKITNTTKYGLFTESDDMVYKFEILITIYTEMIINNLKNIYLHGLENMENVDLSLDNFKIDFTNVSYDILCNPYRKKLLSLGYMLNIDLSTNVSNNYYCKIYFRDCNQHSSYFTMNKNIPNSKKYHFVINGNFKENKIKKLDDIFAIAILNNTIYKISFGEQLINTDTNVDLDELNINDFSI